MTQKKGFNRFNLAVSWKRKYNSKQVELFLYGKNIEELKGKENIKISSLDSLLSNINNYYDDEIYLNKLIIEEIAL